MRLPPPCLSLSVVNVFLCEPHQRVQLLRRVTRVNGLSGYYSGIFQVLSFSCSHQRRRRIHQHYIAPW